MFEQQGTAPARAVEIQSITPSPGTLPPPPPGQTPTAPAAPGAPGLTGDLSSRTYSQLRQILEELRNQRADIASRRTALADTYEAATGANQDGIAARLKILDANIVAYEAEIARVGQAAATKAGQRGGTTEQPSGNIPPGYMHEDDAAGMAFGVFMGTALLAVFFTRRFMGKKYSRMGPPAQPHMIQSNERLDRIEQAVDTIAVEMERVSENQRFMTRLMTETQLGDTLKDVRKSTELAKSAAAEG
jgi:hypothetical protein